MLLKEYLKDSKHQMPKMVFEFQYLHVANRAVFWNTGISATMENVPESHKYKLCSSDFCESTSTKEDCV